ncbi:acetyl-coenzyme A carboxylase carboxyl transferase subunit alpha [Algimonas arctica]|uniref:Acetyl-coenzyme A carboxylase carboxyl transferase subunit alpha n=1 Tax=Algimonas arctica TaxID=1479486 RepID=A0A8J3G2I7_9PROT|nr:acetyl-CoA carboxylase carboxyltransferase subunit alpha [Algimonas arctica]GHA95247.1 acetyl-coenzyme A carboxylase carboxyl transferase subunit alpha [Algimonas arctica]
MALTYLDFERPVAELDKQAVELSGTDPAASQDMTERAATELKKLYAKLGPWEKTQVARHSARPHFSDYVEHLITDYTPLAGDRQFGDDHALLGGTGKIRGRSVVVMGHEKGKDLETRLKHNFGMAQPEGYRKAVRLMNLAERFNLPVISFVDTAGAFPGRGAEERGQAEAIARSIDRGLSLKVPFISVISGEGGSGGAVAIATADAVLMLEHSIYSVISPEGCASILWRDGSRAQDAAKAMKITAQDLKRLGVIDGIIKEPVGGAHRTPDEAIKRVGATIMAQLEELSALDAKALIARRRDKFLNIGRTLPGA